MRCPTCRHCVNKDEVAFIDVSQNGEGGEEKREGGEGESRERERVEGEEMELKEWIWILC